VKLRGQHLRAGCLSNTHHASSQPSGNAYNKDSQHLSPVSGKQVPDTPGVVDGVPETKKTYKPPVLQLKKNDQNPWVRKTTELANNKLGKTISPQYPQGSEQLGGVNTFPTDVNMHGNDIRNFDYPYNRPKNPGLT